MFGRWTHTASQPTLFISILRVGLHLHSTKSMELCNNGILLKSIGADFAEYSTTLGNVILLGQNKHAPPGQ